MGHVTAAVARATVQAPSHVVKSLLLIWRSGTRRWNLRVPELLMSCSDLTERQGTRKVVPVMATKVTGDRHALVDIMTHFAEYPNRTPRHQLPCLTSPGSVWCPDCGTSPPLVCCSSTAQASCHLVYAGNEGTVERCPSQGRPGNETNEIISMADFTA